MRNFSRTVPVFRLCVALTAALAILGNTDAHGQSEFDKWLQGQPYDERKLLDEVQELDQGTFVEPRDAIPHFEASAIALILPLDAPGYVSDVANAFLEGFVQLAESEAVDFTLETYRTDGAPHSGLAAYRQAVADGAGMVIGPLLRSSVERVAAEPARSTIPTILLQEPSDPLYSGQIGASLLYSFPLGGEPEIIQFANLEGNPLQAGHVYVLVENSQIGSRLDKSFGRSWALTGNLPARVRKVVNEESWVEIHDELRELLDEKDEGEEGARDALLPELHGAPTVFAAGGPEFASQARANVPSAIPVYVLSALRSDLDRGGRNLLGLNGIRFFEMPYIEALKRSDSEVLAAGYSSGLPVELQRYVAAGMDAFRIATAFPVWGATSIWSVDGATGHVVLDNGRFLREGRLLELSEGAFIDVNPAEEEERDSAVN